MKNVIVVISIFLFGCGGATTEATTDTASGYVDISSQSNTAVNESI